MAGLSLAEIAIIAAIGTGLLLVVGVVAVVAIINLPKRDHER